MNTLELWISIAWCNYSMRFDYCFIWYIPKYHHDILQLQRIFPDCLWRRSVQSMHSIVIYLRLWLHGHQRWLLKRSHRFQSTICQWTSVIKFRSCILAFQCLVWSLVMAIWEKLEKMLTLNHPLHFIRNLMKSFSTLHEVKYEENEWVRFSQLWVWNLRF